jgi:hypothetical protein
VQLSPEIFILRTLSDSILIGSRGAFGGAFDQTLESEDALRRRLDRLRQDPGALDALRRAFAQWQPGDFMAGVSHDALLARIATASRRGRLAALVPPNGDIEARLEPAIERLSLEPMAPGSIEERLAELLRLCTISDLEQEAVDEFLKARLLEPERLPRHVAVLLAWTRAGERAPSVVADAVLAVPNLDATAQACVAAAREIVAALGMVREANADDDVEEAGRALRRAIALLESEGFVALLDKSAGRGADSARAVQERRTLGRRADEKTPPKLRPRPAPMPVGVPGGAATAAPGSAPGGPFDFIGKWISDLLAFVGLGPKPKPAPPKPKKGENNRTTPKPPLGDAQSKRALKKHDALKKEDRDRFDRLLKEAQSPRERLYLWKALSAGHPVSDIAPFADKIRGKPDQWLDDNLRLTENSSGVGVQQQWSHSCNATMVQAVRGEMDPIYSLQVREENPNLGKTDGADGTKENPTLAEEQRAMLESDYTGALGPMSGGVAAARDDASAGSGRWADDLLNNMSATTGARYTPTKDPTPEAAISSIDAGLADGYPVPIVIGNGTGQYTHYVVVTGKTAGSPAGYSIHDPWTGKTVTRSAEDIKNGTLDIAGSNQITSVEVPKTVP